MYSSVASTRWGIPTMAMVPLMTLLGTQEGRRQRCCRIHAGASTTLDSRHYYLASYSQNAEEYTPAIDQATAPSQ
jgi:hypothetical protein